MEVSLLDVDAVEVPVLEVDVPEAPVESVELAPVTPSWAKASITAASMPPPGGADEPLEAAELPVSDAQLREEALAVEVSCNKLLRSEMLATIAQILPGPSLRVTSDAWRTA